MLIRVRGGASGIVKYLNDGRKIGREFSRDELDKRIVLHGDLDLTDACIKSISKKEKYKHITLSFKEDFVDENLLSDVVEDFKKFAFSAYRDDEYNFYAEAHMPKIKSYINKKTGEFVERKPHIHLVIPKENLLNGCTLDPFGRYELNQSYIEAFQESINSKYGFASPNDNARNSIFNESEIISRYKGDYFKGSSNDIKSTILSQIINNNIDSKEKFHELLLKYGDVKIRNEGKKDEYFNIKMNSYSKGINLKDMVFRDGFIQKSHKEKIESLSNKDSGIKYESVGTSSDTPDLYLKLLDDWHSVKAKEIKYINSGSRDRYRSYKLSSEVEKLSILKKKEANFYEKFDITLDTPELASPTTGMALEPNVTLAHKAESNLISQLVGDALEKDLINTSEVSVALIKSSLSADLLLKECQKNYAVLPEKYSVSRAKDGTGRILCGSRNLNVSDFLTKELGLQWKDAESFLRNVFLIQNQQKHDAIPSFDQTNTVKPEPPTVVPVANQTASTLRSASSPSQQPTKPEPMVVPVANQTASTLRSASSPSQQPTKPEPMVVPVTIKSDKDWLIELSKDFESVTGISVPSDIRMIDAPRAGLILFGNERFMLMDVGRRELFLLDKNTWSDLSVGHFYRSKNGAFVPTPIPYSSKENFAYYGDVISGQVSSWFERDRQTFTKNKEGKDRGGR